MPLPFINETNEYTHGACIKLATKPQNVPKINSFPGPVHTEMKRPVSKLVAMGRWASGYFHV